RFASREAAAISEFNPQGPPMSPHPTPRLPGFAARLVGAALAFALALPLLHAAPSDGQFKNSWIRLWTQVGDAPSPESTVYSDGANTQTTHGQAVNFTVHAEYYLDPADKGDSRVFLAIDPLLNWPDVKESDIGPDGTLYVTAKAGRRKRPHAPIHRPPRPL